MNIIWSPEILDDIDTLIEYLQKDWPESVLKDFQQNLFDKIDLLER